MEKKQFNEIISLHRGYDLPSDDRVSGCVPLYAANGLSDRVSKSKIDGPGVITGRSGTIGNVFFCRTSFWPLNTTLFVSDFHGNDPHYISYWLSRFPLSNFAGGASVPTLNRNELSKSICSIHSKDEQRHIVGTRRVS